MTYHSSSDSSPSLPRDPSATGEVWFLCGAEHPASRPRFESECLALGLEPCWLDPFLLEVDPTTGRSQYAGRPAGPPLMAIARTGGLTSDRVLETLRALDAIGVPLVDSADSVALCRDKLAQLRVLKDAGLPVPSTLSLRGVEPDSDLDALIGATLGGWPVVTKRSRGMGGEGVELVAGSAALRRLLDSPRSARPTLAQAFVPSEYDVRVIVASGQALGAMRRIRPERDFRANLARAGRAERHPLTDDVSSLALTAADAVGAAVAGVDLLPSGNGWLVIEVNTAPGFEGFERVTGANVAAAILSAALTEAARA